MPIRVLDRQPDMEVVGIGAGGEEAIELFHRHRPDVTLMDLQLGAVSGVEAIPSSSVNPMRPGSARGRAK